MQHATFHRSHHRPARALPFLGDLTLTPARSHEFCGPARHTLAMMLAGANEGPVFWVAPGWGANRLYGPGMAAWANPARFTFIQAARAEDVLWSLEEVLRSGAVPLVVGELEQPPALTPVRRLHLAAENGLALTNMAPTAVLLTADGGAQGVESRWHMAPAHQPGEDRWRLTRQRARSQPPRDWMVQRKEGHTVLAASKGSAVPRGGAIAPPQGGGSARPGGSAGRDLKGATA